MICEWCDDRPRLRAFPSSLSHRPSLSEIVTISAVFPICYEFSPLSPPLFRANVAFSDRKNRAFVGNFAPLPRKIEDDLTGGPPIF